MHWGIITAAAFLLAAAKYVTHRLPGKRGDKLFLKLHLVGGGLLPVGALVHGIARIRDGGFRRSISATAAGLAGCLGIDLLMFSHFFSKKLGKRAMPLHRAATVLTGVSILAHAALLMSAKKR